MAEGRFGVERPFVDDDGEGPLGVSRPLAKTQKEQLIDLVESAIGDEGSAEQEYLGIIIQAREMGMDDVADEVEAIRKDEMRHEKQFKRLLKELQQ